MRTSRKPILLGNVAHKVFVDTNVILEHAMMRTHWRDCLKIFRLAETGQISCMASSASFFTLAYFVRKAEKRKEIINEYLSFIEPIPTSKSALDAALKSNYKDIEDGFQYYTAYGIANSFVTLNLKDFSNFEVPVLKVFEPGQFLRSIEKR